MLHVGPLPPVDFAYPGFVNPSSLLLTGQAVITNSLLRLTRDVANDTGGAWHAFRVRVDQPFETVFPFRISRDGANGFAFLVQNDSLRALGSSGSSLAYNISNSVAVEFDTWQNTIGDPNANHISVHTRGLLAHNANHAYSLGAVSNLTVNMSDTLTHPVKLTYRPGWLSVFLQDLNEPVLIVPLDLANTLSLSGGLAWVGFTATAGGGSNYEAHDILNWRFQHSLTPPNDSDGDGLPDWWELRYFGGPTNGIATADLDLDGMSTLQEYIADTNPTNRFSLFQLTAMRLGSQCRVRAWTSARRVYQLEHRSALTPAAPWLPEAAWLPGVDGWQEWSVPAGEAAGFFRARVALP